MADGQLKINETVDKIFHGVSLTDIPNLFQTPPTLKDMQDMHDVGHTFMIKPFKYDPSNPNREPEPIHGVGNYWDIWNDDHVRLPCSPCNVTPPPLLRIETNRSVTMSQRQAASLLACAFFCLFPHQFNGQTSQTYQSFNFIHLLQSGSPWKLEKLKCILHYFRRISEDMSKGVLTFRRFALPAVWKPNWIESHAPLCKIHLRKDTTIEDMYGLLQVDFANEFIGGGVMNEGIVQEEIRFTICTEMLISVLVCEVMLPNECIFLIGCEQYTTYSGYATTFKAKDNFFDKTPKDSWGRKLSHVVAMDAINYLNPLDQYTIECMSRELIKAYTCFRIPKSMEKSMFGIATGNWGCGAFNGDRQLKGMNY
ncbi:unnamed protein product [Rotaria sp. Silwood2]|nr:unnamed protein product [Rotaria sp. Silwood2]CAF3883266.1 unnamed protein product [Rotaria sp. Silwood2]